jgi:hypothetical protein
MWRLSCLRLQELWILALLLRCRLERFARRAPIYAHFPATSPPSASLPHTLDAQTRTRFAQDFFGVGKGKVHFYGV